jgi:threo-3-hydroxy-L-aspartate ammonia-lyase
VTVASLPELVSLESIRAAAADLVGVAVRTPLLPADALSDQLGTPVFVKPESLQRVGAFKLRGAYTLVRRLVREGATGVITYSSGNHGQAVAYVAQLLGLRAVIVMPETVPDAKRRGVERLGGEVVLAGRTSADRHGRAQEIAAREGLAMAPPFEHEAIIAGQGTVGLEIVADCPTVGTVCVPVGGGGLSSGVATAVKGLCPSAEVVTVEPEGAPKFHTSRRQGERVVLDRTASIADGLITLSVGALNYRHLMRFTDRSVLVSDAALTAAVRYAIDRLKLVVEPSGAATLAWLLAPPTGSVRGPVVAVLSGGNIEWDGLVRLLGGPS